MQQAMGKRMPKRLKSQERRQRLAAEVLEANGMDGVCMKDRYPKQILVVGASPETRLHPEQTSNRRYEDALRLVDGPGRPGGEEVERLAAMPESKRAHGHVYNVCLLLREHLFGVIVERVAAHPGRAFGAITGRWLCARVAKLCDASSVEFEADDSEEEGEL